MSKLSKFMEENRQQDIDNLFKLYDERNERVWELEEEMENFKQQLAEKDKEIEKLKNLILNLTDGKGAVIITKEYLEGKNEKIFKVENLRHQICEQIRDFCKVFGTEDDNGALTINIDKKLHTKDNLLDFLDKIEKGE